jgi:hypothetical protein
VRLVLLGDDTCSLVLGDQHFGVNEVVSFEPSLEVGSQQSFLFKVQFAPRDELPTECRLVIFGNSENSADGFEVPILGNNAGPCIDVSPQKVNFGAKLKGGTLSEMELDISSCGEEALQVTAARLSISDDEGDAELGDLGVLTSSPQFALDFENVTDDGEPPTDSKPLVIPVNDQNTVKVRYTTPNSESLRDQSGAPIPDRGFIVLQTNAFQKYVIIEVTGFSVSVLCPTAVIEVAEGTNVIPQTTIHLDGSASFSPNGAIEDYKWSIEQPDGSVAVFLPNTEFPTPQVELNVAGEYKICLTVRDKTGQESCEPACEVVTVTPDEAIHVELLWNTPGDPDEFDEGPRSGTDLDLHFIHPFAGGQDLDADGEPDGYFSDPFDCFWFNPHPDWGTVDPNVDDNPGLDRDDTDGAGPENMNLNVPEDDVTYKVGVHYWQDPKSSDFPQGFGNVLATVRVYIFGKKVWEKEGVQLTEKDMWEVATVHWPSQAIQPIFGNGPGGMKIIPNYENPFFIQ